MSDEPKSCSTCSDTSCSAKQRKPGENDSDFLDRQAIAARMCQVGKKLVVLSGKGGVGKSTVAVNLAAALAQAGKRVGLLDIDIHGPSIPKLLKLEGAKVEGTETSIFPVRVGDNLYVMSIGLLLPERDDAVIWRGPMKYGAIMQFLRDVEWGKLDYLIVDSPPGTGDEPLSVIQLLENPDGAIIVTTPQQLSIQDVRRSIRFCQTLGLPVVGVVENMSGFVCPHCGKTTDIFGSGGGEEMARQMGVPFLGRIPLEPGVVTSGDDGVPIVEAHPHSETAKAFGRLLRKLLEPEFAEQAERPAEGGNGAIKIAVPVAQGNVCLHFGHCEQFALFEVDTESKRILGSQLLTPPPHEPGVFPRWLSEQGAKVVLAGGMGARAQSLFNQAGVRVVTGVQGGNPEQVVQAYLDGTLQTGANVCDH